MTFIDTLKRDLGGKSNYVIFHPPQRKILCSPILEINGKHLKREFGIKYLGIFIDSHLNWKS